MTTAATTTTFFIIDQRKRLASDNVQRGPFERRLGVPVRSRLTQKDRMGLFIHTIDLARATTKIGLANLTYNMKRLIWLQRMEIA